MKNNNFIDQQFSFSLPNWSEKQRKIFITACYHHEIPEFVRDRLLSECEKEPEIEIEPDILDIPEDIEPPEEFPECPGDIVYCPEPNDPEEPLEVEEPEIECYERSL